MRFSFNTIKYFFNKGPRQTCLYARHRFSEWKHDHYFSARTGGWIPFSKLATYAADSHDYEPVPYSIVIEAFRSNLSPQYQNVFVDYGCGKGRILLLAGLYAFHEIIGIELSPELYHTALKNISQASSKLVCDNIKLLNINAIEFCVPNNATALHFYNPFGLSTLRSVVEQ